MGRPTVAFRLPDGPRSLEHDLSGLALLGLLLIVLPGRSGREAVLRRIRAEVGPLALLVPRNLLAASQWAQPLAESWIETESRLADVLRGLRYRCSIGFSMVFLSFSWFFIGFPWSSMVLQSFSMVFLISLQPYEVIHDEKTLLGPCE